MRPNQARDQRLRVMATQKRPGGSSIFAVQPCARVQLRRAIERRQQEDALRAGPADRMSVLSPNITMKPEPRPSLLHRIPDATVATALPFIALPAPVITLRRCEASKQFIPSGLTTRRA